MRIEIESLVEGVDVSETVTRARFEELCADLFRQTLVPVEQAMPPHTSPYLPISPHTSPYLPISPHISLRQVALEARFKYTYVFGVGLVTLMRMCGEVMTSQSRAGTWYAAYPP